MKSNNRVEIILFSKYPFKDVHQKQLVSWLGRTAQPAIDRQLSKARKLYLKTLEDTPPIYLS
jgi:hypothetical protein